MDLAVLLPLALVFGLQSLISLSLLLPRAASKHVAALLASTIKNSVMQTVLLTLAAAVLAMTISSGVQLAFVLQNLHNLQRSDRWDTW